MAELKVVMYHYVRDLPHTRFPRINGMMLDEFRGQVRALRARHEMASLESCLAFLRGKYRPSRDLCLLTFDDGFKEHFANVTPLLVDEGIAGLFFVITSCLEDGCVAPVHMNHFLTAAMGFEEYKNRFLAALSSRLPCGTPILEEQGEIAQRTYPWDTAEVASFKYLINFQLEARVRDETIRELFETHIDSQASFARQLYVNWEELRQMQSAQMVIGGHTHSHRPIAAMQPDEMSADLSRCRELLEKNLAPQLSWPFSYPYGKRSSFTDESIARLKELDFHCSFSTEPGMNSPETDLFCIRRIDCKFALTQSA